jgi:hypothetical protein
MHERLHASVRGQENLFSNAWRFASFSGPENIASFNSRRSTTSGSDADESLLYALFSQRLYQWPISVSSVCPMELSPELSAGVAAGAGAAAGAAVPAVATPRLGAIAGIGEVITAE